MSDFDKAFDELMEQFKRKPVAVDVEPETAVAVKSPPSETALKTDRWSRRIADRLVNDWWGYNDHELSNCVADAHTACFEPRPVMADECVNPLKQRWFEDLLASPDFKALHASTCLDDSLAQIAAKQITDRYLKYAEREGDNKVQEREEEDFDTQVERGRSIGKAVQDALGDVSDARDAGAAFGDADGNGNSPDPQAVLRAFKAIQNNPVLRKISECAGKFTRMAKSLQRQKPVHGMDDVTGVELAGDLNRLTITELSCLMDDDLELDLLRRVMDGQAMCREYGSVASVGRGPIMVLVDESGSMDDDMTAAAKGFALSMAWLAQHQKRWCCLVGWSSHNEIRTLVIEPNTQNPGVMGWCASKFDGGTDPPVGLIPELFEKTGAPEGKTDVIWITDGECNPSGVDRFNEWRKEHSVKVWTIGIGCAAKSFTRFSDNVVEVSGIETGSPVVAELLSL